MNTPYIVLLSFTTKSFQLSREDLQATLSLVIYIEELEQAMFFDNMYAKSHICRAP
jgi:hypothetical protein